jgi:hypothetical protein
MTAFTATYADDSTPQRTFPPGPINSTDWDKPSVYDATGQTTNWQWQMQQTLYWLTQRDASRAANTAAQSVPATLAPATTAVLTPNPAVQAQQQAAAQVIQLANQLSVLTSAGLGAGDPTFDLLTANLAAAQTASGGAITARAAVDTNFASLATTALTSATALNTAKPANTG